MPAGRIAGITLVVIAAAFPVFAQQPSSTADAATTPPGASNSVVISDELKELTWIGFQQLKDASRVFVRTNEPVKYHLVWQDDKTLVLELFNTAVLLRNHLRFLDTRFFQSPVLFVEPKVIEAVSPTTRVVMTVEQKVPYRVKQEDNLIFVDFRR